MQSGKDSPSFGQLEPLETRAMLFNALEVLDNYDGDIFLDFPANVSTDDGSVVAPPEANEPLPVIPFDHSVSPLKECPGLPAELCLPGDLDGNGGIDFPDFLILSGNYGLEFAKPQDGDLSGDGIVSFADFLALSANFGKTA